MLTIKQYVRPETLDEAYTLCQKRGNVVLGGMLWLKMENLNVNTVIDLSGLGLDTIQETDTEFTIGAMVSLRQLETHPGLNDYTGGCMGSCVAPIVGVQFRNLATIGGRLWGKFGFSDPLTLFLALGAKLRLHGLGEVSLADWLKMSAVRDILTHVVIPKTPCTVAYLSQRNTATDFPVLTCAVCRRGEKIVCAVGARPSRAALFTADNALWENGITEQSARAFAEQVAETAGFGSNMRASAEYRKTICRVLVRRAVLQLAKEN